ncbi:hypothetical protein EV663_1056 [Rhodovulum bhavnagarense]|uniref:Alpha/beta hydrolase family protein n=1 Tax=Rhodovulum bhavnagarense TaxID=992286 RepID=A0A4R2RFZ9_9RHOB|nr:hypothetical protein [Rhodovulum bhavnagarense]TCP61289.1 hypothetical protein EV663_1056 [Rhodovulum bhavnagarense]
MSDDPKRVRHRRVFYIPGYDPFHPRRYRELYRKEAAAQSAVSGHDIALSAKRGGGPYGWHVNARIEGQEVDTEVEVLIWADLVRDSMGRSILATYFQLLRTAAIYIGSGAIFRLARLRKGPTIAALYPIVFLLAQLCLALLIARGLGAVLGATGVPFIGWLGLVAIWPVLTWFRSRDNKVFAYYLMHDYAHSARHGGAYPPDLARRLREFGERVADAAAGGADEVLIVGHSSGAHLGVSVLADLVRAGRLPADGPAVGLLSLGQVVPMISFLPRARRLRADLALMAAQDRVAWVDVTGPGDGCAFALCDPVAVSGVAPEGQKWPLIVSAAFSRTLSPTRWRALRWRFFRLHFQYLCAFDLPGDYDYFRITAGPQTLAARFAGRTPSPSRITRPLSGFTSMEYP